MFKIPITYRGLDGKEKTRDFYFNLNKGEIAEIHISLPGGLDGFIDKLNDDPDVEHIVEVFKKLILKSYGKRTADGKFIKTKELSEEFAASDAYSELFLKFIDNENDFVNTFLENTLNVPPEEVKKIMNEGPEEVKKLEDTIQSDF